MLGAIGRGATCPVKMFQQRPKPLGDIFQGFPRQPASPHVHVDIEIADSQACKIGVRMLDEPGTKTSSFPQQGVDRSRGEPAFLPQPRLMLFAHLSTEKFASGGRRFGWPALQRELQQRVDS